MGNFLVTVYRFLFPTDTKEHLKGVPTKEGGQLPTDQPPVNQLLPGFLWPRFRSPILQFRVFQPPAFQPAANQPPPANQPSTDHPSADQSSADQLSTDQPLIVPDSMVQNFQFPGIRSPSIRLPRVRRPFEQPPVNHPPVNQLPGGQSSGTPELEEMPDWIASKTPKAKILFEKERYAQMSVLDRRVQYQCGVKFKTLEDLVPWGATGKTVPPPSDMLLNIVEIGVPQGQYRSSLNCKVSLVQLDITTMEVDAIVSAVNSTLLGGGRDMTVDGAIHTAAGPMLKEECATLGGCKPGEAKITGGYKLPAKNVIHTVRPKGEDPGTLAACYLSCLDLLKEHSLKSVAFPCISTGIFGYPLWKATTVALETVKAWMNDNYSYITQMDRIIFCVHDEEAMQEYYKQMRKNFPVSDRGDELEELIDFLGDDY